MAELRGRCPRRSSSSWIAPATSRCWSRRTTPEAETRLENLDELVNAAAEAAERGETRRRLPGSCRAGGRRRCARRAAPRSRC